MDIKSIIQEKKQLFQTVFFILSLVVLLVGGFLLAFFHYSKPERLVQTVFRFANIQIEGVVFDHLVGGDITIEPPAHVVPQLPQLIGELPGGEQFTASHIIVKDVESGATLFGKDEYGTWPIASITKLMSALVIMEYDPAWSSSTAVVGEDWLDVHMYKGDTYTREQLWNAALIVSSNKAILSLIQSLDVPREEFVARMNTKALELGMTETIFVEPTGLDQGNVSTASDIAILLKAALQEENIQKAVLTREYNLYSKERKKNHHMWSTNWLLLNWIPHDFAKLHGGKTGFIDAAQYNFAVEIEDETGRAVDVVVLGADSNESRFSEARDVAKAVFTNYRWPGQVLDEAEETGQGVSTIN